MTLTKWLSDLNFPQYRDLLQYMTRKIEMVGSEHQKKGFEMAGRCNRKMTSEDGLPVKTTTEELAMLLLKLYRVKPLL